MATNIEIQDEDDDDEEDDDPIYANVETKTTAQRKHPQKIRSVRRPYRLVRLGFGLLCGVQALLNIGLRLSLYSTLTEENNNLVKDLDQLQSSFEKLQSKNNNLTEQKDQCGLDLDHIQSNYEQIKSIHDNLAKQKDQIQSSYEQLKSIHDNLAKQKDQIQSGFDHLLSRKNKTIEQDDIKRILCESHGFTFDGGLCYYFSGAQWKPWELSRQHCTERQSDLMIINSKEKQDFVNRVVPRQHKMWLGLTDGEEEGVWKWVDGTPLTTPTYWHHGEPAVDYNNEEDCVVFLNGFWGDRKCSHDFRWMCERVF